MAGHTDNSVVIDAPLDLVWDMTNDIENWTELFSEYAESTVLERDNGRIRFRLALHPDDNGVVWSWVSERIPDEQTYTVRSQRVDTGNFKYMWLYWEYSKENDGVRMRWVQDFELKPGLPMDDGAMAARLNGNTLKQLDVIKTKIEAVAHATVR
ncbi:MAG TPA: SRPBCC family protein [Pseudonocardiaceae bacterium]|jgi:aromatase